MAYEIEKNTQIKQKYLLNQLINGIIGNKEVFYQECIDIGIKLIAQYHSIVIVQKNKEVVSELEILSFIQNYMKDKGEINYAHIVQILKDNIFVLLIGVNEKKNLTQHLFKKHNFKIAIGTIESDVYCIPNAYIRARSFFELSEAEESNILAWDQIEEYIGATRC